MISRPLRIVSVLAVLAAAVLWSNDAKAITLVPPTLEFSAKPGETIQTKIKVINEEAKEVTLYPSTANFAAKDETGQPDFKFDAPTADLASWITADVTKITLAPRGVNEVSLSISVPNDAEPGGHYAGFFLGTAAPQGSQLQLQSKLGTLVILRIDGQIREQAEVVQFGAAESSYNRLPVDLILRLRNSGNVHVRPGGTITIRNMFGGVSATMPINPKEGAVLPESIRRFDLEWQKGTGDVQAGNFFQEIGAEWRHFALGTYTAELNGTYGQSSKALSASFKITIIPWRVLLVTLVLLVVIIWLLVFVMRRYNAMIIRKAQSPHVDHDQHHS